MSQLRIITTNGSERSIKGAAIDKLASELRGQLLRCDDPGYDVARKVWNGMIDKRPALIARCAGAADVISCVRFTTFSCPSAVVDTTMRASPSARGA
jgi:hypothetical protein